MSLEYDVVCIPKNEIARKYMWFFFDFGDL